MHTRGEPRRGGRVARQRGSQYLSVPSNGVLLPQYRIRFPSESKTRTGIFPTAPHHVENRRHAAHERKDGWDGECLHVTWRGAVGACLG